MARKRQREDRQFESVEAGRGMPDGKDAAPAGENVLRRKGGAQVQSKYTRGKKETSRKLDQQEWKNEEIYY